MFVRYNQINGYTKIKNMKKLMLLLFVASTIAVTSCKKESEVTPTKNDKTLKMDGSEDQTSLDKSTLGHWD